MKIGEKEYTPFYNNRSIYELEEAFGDRQITQVMGEIESFTTKQLGLVIWHGIKSELTWDEFVDTIELGQYGEAGKECGEALVSAFTTGIKKK